MFKESKAHLQLVENTTPSTSKKGRGGGAELPEALEDIGQASSSEEAFYRLQEWSKTEAALEASVYDVEQEPHRGGLEVLRLMLEENIRSRGVGDVGEAIARRTDDDQEVRLGYRREHDRQYESIFGTIKVDRLGYGSPGEPSIHPLDEELNLPQRRYSYVVQKRGAKLVGRGPYDDAVEEIEETTAAHVPKRQMEEIVKDAAKDFDGFYTQRCSSLPAPNRRG